MIGQQIRDRVFRDTPTFYKSSPKTVSPGLIKFARKHAGQSILDFGCATGDYALQLSQWGYQVKGVDVNQEYVDIARQRGVDAFPIQQRAPFEDKAFDTVMAFEVLEHVAHPADVLSEMKRLARKNVLLTVPNCENAEEMQKYGLLLEHFADLDHKSFFSKDSLSELMKAHFTKMTVWRGDEISPVALLGPAPVRWMGQVAKKMGLIRSNIFFRLFAVGSCE